MRRAFAVLALVFTIGATVGHAAQEQRAWQPEVGVQGGYTRLVAAGAGLGPTDVISLPGFSFGNAVPAANSIYAVFPWRNKVAVEGDIAASQLAIGIGFTVLSLGLRVNYAVTEHMYAAAGGALTYNNGINDETQLGVQGAVGYRLRVSGTLNGRVEARATFFGKAENIGPINTYSALVGVSTPTRRPAARAARPPRAAGTERSWSPQLGIAAGYANVHLVGGGSLTALAIPGYGGALAPIINDAITLPPTVFAIIPVGARIALEPAVDVHRFQEGGQTDFIGNLGARLNYAVHGGWYGAVGGNLVYVKSTGADAATRTGLQVAWGYRFPFSGSLGGRVELNYTMFGENTDLAVPPVNTFAVLVGVMVPLK